MRKGDICFQKKGGMTSSKGEIMDSYDLFEYDPDCDRGHAVRYNHDGSKFEFAWAYPSLQNRVVLDKDIKRSFKNGQYSFYLSEKKKVTPKNINKKIRESDFVIIPLSDVKKRKLNLEVKTIDDVLNNIDNIKIITPRIAMLLFDYAGVYKKNIPEDERMNEAYYGGFQDSIYASAIIADIKTKEEDNALLKR